MESYTTISVKPRTKKKVRLLKASETYSEYLDRVVQEEWDESEFDETDLDNPETANKKKQVNDPEDVGKMTNSEVKEHVENITDIDYLETMLEKEKEDDNRVGATETIEDRIEKLSENDG